MTNEEITQEVMAISTTLPHKAEKHFGRIVEEARRAATAVEMEREACALIADAKVNDLVAGQSEWKLWQQACEEIAAAIRARGQASKP